MKKLKIWIFNKYFKGEIENYLIQLENIIKKQKNEIKNLKNRLSYYHNKGVL